MERLRIRRYVDSSAQNSRGGRGSDNKMFSKPLADGGDFRQTWRRPLANAKISILRAERKVTPRGGGNRGLAPSSCAVVGNRGASDVPVGVDFPRGFRIDDGVVGQQTGLFGCLCFFASVFCAS